MGRTHQPSVRSVSPLHGSGKTITRPPPVNKSVPRKTPRKTPRKSIGKSPGGKVPVLQRAIPEDDSSYDRSDDSESSQNDAAFNALPDTGT
jgi:hypothetical protein